MNSLKALIEALEAAALDCIDAKAKAEAATTAFLLTIAEDGSADATYDTARTARADADARVSEATTTLLAIAAAVVIVHSNYGAVTKDTP